MTNTPANWTIHEDGTIDVDGSVQVESSWLEGGHLRYNFGTVSGSMKVDMYAATRLESLKGFPRVVASSLNLDGTHIGSLQYGPEVVGGVCNIRGCPNLRSLKYLPARLAGLDVRRTPISSLEFIEGTRFVISGPGPLPSTKLWLDQEIRSHVLGLFYTGCTGVVNALQIGREFEWTKIVNKYLPLGQKGIAQCSIALIKAGFKNLAQL